MKKPVKSSNEQSADGIINQCADLLSQEIHLAQVFDILAAFAFAMAIFFLLRRAQIAMTKLQAVDAKITTDQTGVAAVSLSDVKGMLQALKGFAEALKDTPASITLALIALAFFFMPATNIGAPCEDILKVKDESIVNADERKDAWKAALEGKPETLTLTKEEAKFTIKASWKKAAGTAAEPTKGAPAN